VRQPTSHLASGLELFSRVDVQLARGRSLDVVTQVVRLDEHRLAAELERTAHAALIAELADRVTEDRHPMEGIYDLTAAALVGYGLGVPVWTAVEILPRAFFALKDTWTPVLVNLVTLATACALSVVGVYLAHGDSILGVALLAATGLAALMLLAAVFHVTRRELLGVLFNLILGALAVFVAYARYAAPS